MLRCQPPFWCIPPALASDWPRAPAPTAETFQCFFWRCVYTTTDCAALPLCVQHHNGLLNQSYPLTDDLNRNLAQILGCPHEEVLLKTFASNTRPKIPPETLTWGFCLRAWRRKGQRAAPVTRMPGSSHSTLRELMWTPWSHCICLFSELVLLICTVCPHQILTGRFTSQGFFVCVCAFISSGIKFKNVFTFFFSTRDDTNSSQRVY